MRIKVMIYYYKLLLSGLKFSAVVLPLNIGDHIWRHKTNLWCNKYLRNEKRLHFFAVNAVKLNSKQCLRPDTHNAFSIQVVKFSERRLVQWSSIFIQMMGVRWSKTQESKLLGMLYLISVS